MRQSQVETPLVSNKNDEKLDTIEKSISPPKELEQKFESPSKKPTVPPLKMRNLGNQDSPKDEEIENISMSSRSEQNIVDINEVEISLRPSLISEAKNSIA